MPVIERRRRSLINDQSAWLIKHAHNVNSQFGEDGITTKIFEIIGEGARWSVEFGAVDGRHLSNTWNMIENRNWSGVLIECNPRTFAMLQHNMAAYENVFPLNAYVGWQGEQLLDTILPNAPIPKNFDLLSIDIDGNDWHVWRALELYRPRVVISEFNPTIPNDVFFVQDPDANLNQGCSLLALIELGKQKGYEIVAATEANGIFVERDLFPLFNITDNGIDALYDCKQDIALFHGYDGTFFGAGHMRVIWHGMPVAQDDLQVLPLNMRKYPG